MKALDELSRLKNSKARMLEKMPTPTPSYLTCTGKDIEILDRYCLGYCGHSYDSKKRTRLILPEKDAISHLTTTAFEFSARNVYVETEMCHMVMCRKDMRLCKGSGSANDDLFSLPSNFLFFLHNLSLPNHRPTRS